MRAKNKGLVWLAAILAVIGVCVAAQPLYVISALNWARSQGVYRTPQEGVIDRAYRYYCGVEKVVIEQAATNSFDGSNPHIWYVIYRVYAKGRAPCGAQNTGQPLYHQDQGYEGGGNFYLDTKDGWVMMPEGHFPEYIGAWMLWLKLAGPGNTTHVPRD